ncbi:MAG: hypothetical protein ABMB14_25865 [Myxococcota bacterium]
MARSLTVKHEESPSALFATFLILCGGFLLLGAAVGASADPGEENPPTPIESAAP